MTTGEGNLLLIADDDPSTQMAVFSAFQGRFNVICAPTVDDFLRLYHQHAPSVRLAAVQTCLPPEPDDTTPQHLPTTTIAVAQISTQDPDLPLVAVGKKGRHRRRLVNAGCQAGETMRGKLVPLLRRLLGFSEE